LNNEHLAYYGFLFLGWALYAVLTLRASVLTAQGLGFSLIQSIAIVLTLVIPYGVIWFIALYSALRLRSYVQTILKTPDGAAFARIDAGLFILVVALVLPPVLGAIPTTYASVSGLVVPLTLVINYSYTILPLIAFGFIFAGTSSLVTMVKSTRLSRTRRFLSVLPLAVVAPLYVWLTFTIPNITETYHLPDILIACTILLPAVLAWVFGILGAVNMGFYGKEVPGIIYKKSVALIVTGVSVLTGGSIFFLVVSSLGPRLSFVGIGTFLAIVYVFLAILGLGYISVARGATRLSRLEAKSP
jgi:hypothetical protein